MEIKREHYTVKVGEPTVYVDNQSRGRSGHMTHAMVEWKPGCLMDFNSNCSAVRCEGHSTFGYVEYRLSEDGGETYSEIYDLPYSKESLYDGIYVISVEKAVACEDGTIVAFCLRNNAEGLCTPWDTPMIARSLDGGKTWTKETEMCTYKGRVYDAVVHDGVIYALEFCNPAVDHFYGYEDEHVYRIFTSHDNGVHFEELCNVPIPSINRAYGAMLFDGQGALHVYAYNRRDEVNMDHIVSMDCGKTWQEAGVCYLTMGIRNPQVALMDGVFILHGRNGEFDGCDGFVLYTSRDGHVWDEGTYLFRAKGCCYYSNNIVLQDSDGKNRLLVQYSESYGRELCVNVKHVWIRIEHHESK